MKMTPEQEAVYKAGILHGLQDVKLHLRDRVMGLSGLNMDSENRAVIEAMLLGLVRWIDDDIKVKGLE
jgi:hypothetical protein